MNKKKILSLIQKLTLILIISLVLIKFIILNTNPNTNNDPKLDLTINLT